jgi:hypothetical protein
MRATGSTLPVVLALVLGAGCDLRGFGAGEDCADDPEANHHALNPSTGECWEFASSCDVPTEWASCEAPPECGPDAECPPTHTCVEGACVPVMTECGLDEECLPTQYCDPSGHCVDNAPCLFDGECPMDQWCSNGAGDCDPTLPDCGAPQEGLCSRGPRPSECAIAADCSFGEVCTAEAGIGTQCEPVCYDDTTCAPEQLCNASTVCLVASGGKRDYDVPGLYLCGGWCVDKEVPCATSLDCGSGETCPGESGGGAPGYPYTCETGCWDNTQCQPDETCNAGLVCIGPPNGKRGEGDGIALPCYGWCVPL